ncbi:MAG: hypothetical protein IPJ74_09025 [Saprospiraceae bacterium]|nr:hypothetical protein [Saprospiraceae bacterium]
MNQTGVYSTPDPFLADEKPIDLRLIIYKYLLRYWYLYALGLIIALSIAFVRLRYATKQYMVRGTILIKNPEGEAPKVFRRKLY